MDITEVQLALNLTLLLAAVTLGSWAIVGRIMAHACWEPVCAALQPYRAEGWATLPQDQIPVPREGGRTAANRAPPVALDSPRISPGLLSR